MFSITIARHITVLNWVALCMKLPAPALPSTMVANCATGRWSACSKNYWSTDTWLKAPNMFSNLIIATRSWSAGSKNYWSTDTVACRQHTAIFSLLPEAAWSACSKNYWSTDTVGWWHHTAIFPLLPEADLLVAKTTGQLTLWADGTIQQSSHCYQKLICL